MLIFKPLSTIGEWGWIHRRSKPFRCEDSIGIVALDDHTREIYAIAVFDSFLADSCCMHIAIDNPMVIRRGFLTEIARYLFVNCERKRVFGYVPSSNRRSLRFARHAGWAEVSRVPDAVAEGVDYVVFRMDRDNCRWLPAETLKDAA
jgi:hypothetical protein